MSAEPHDHALSSEHHRVTVGDDDVGKRLDKLLAERLPDVSRSLVATQIKAGRVRLEGDDGPLKASWRAAGGETILIALQRPSPPQVVAQDLPLDVRYRDDDVLVLHKRAGRVMHPAAGHEDGTVVNALVHHVPALAKTGAALRPGLVHRLDKDTSGLLVVALHDAALRRLSRDFAAHKVERRYVAITLGRVLHEAWTITSKHGRHPRDRKRFSTRVEQGKHAVTHVALRATSPLASLVICTLETGRTHQIRAHLADRGHPIAGDALYGGVRKHPRTHRTVADITALSRLRRQALHAYALGFRHPRTGEWLRFEADWPDDLGAVAEALFGEAAIALPPLSTPVYAGPGQPAG
jgi:23S rRNA pseudouridine1911/1915/1917 synthase